jgi:hypothetical protein
VKTHAETIAELLSKAAETAAASRDWDLRRELLRIRDRVVTPGLFDPPPRADTYDVPTDALGTGRDTLEEAIAAIANGLYDGIPCPACHQLCKVYNRGLGPRHAAWLIDLVKTYLNRAPGSWVHIDDIRTQKNGDYGRVAQWGLAERKPRQKGEPCSGLWRPTRLGIEFVYGIVAVPAQLKVVDNVVKERSSRLISISGALGNSFSYEWLMIGAKAWGSWDPVKELP